MSSAVAIFHATCTHCSPPALDVGIIARADSGLVRGSLLRESDGLRRARNARPSCAGIHERMMDEDQNDRPGTIVPTGISAGATYLAIPLFYTSAGGTNGAMSEMALLSIS